MRAMLRQQVIMIGPSLTAPGGMSAVAESYRRDGLFVSEGVRYLSSYEGPALGLQLRVMFRLMLEVCPMLLRGRVRLMHVHSASRGSFWRKALCCLWARVCRVPYVFHVHSGEFPVFYAQESGALARWVIRRVLMSAGCVLALAEPWRDALARIAPGARIEVLPNPVELPETAAMPALRPSGQTLLFLGRLREKKGVFDLLAAFKGVVQRVPDARLVLAGDGDLEGARGRIAELGLLGRVELPGWVDGAQKQAMLESADALVLPSYFEGLPICVLEAMALGIPVLATRVGGVPDALDGGDCGLLVEAGDVPALTEGLVRVLTDSKARVEWRTRARRKAEAVYASRRVVARLSGIYAELEHGMAN